MTAEFLTSVEDIYKLSLDSLLEALVQNGDENKLLKVLAQQEVEVNRVAKFEIKSKMFATSHSLHIWMLAKCHHCLLSAKTKPEAEIIFSEANRLVKVVEILEKIVATAPRDKANSELFFGTETGDLLTSPVTKFLKKALSVEKPLANGISEGKVDANTEDSNGDKKDAVPSRKEDEEVSKFVPVLRNLVKSANPESPFFDGGFASWDDIHGYEDVKQEIYDDYVLPRIRQSRRADIKEADPNLKMCLMLYGPPGTGKTMMAEAIATQLEWNLMCVSQVDFSSSMSGQNLQKLKAVFIVACDAAPLVLLFDEMEVMFPDRQNVRNEHKMEEIGQFLVLLNGLKKHNLQNPLKQVLVLGATNLPKNMDPATWRRLESWIHVPLPDDESKRHMVESFLGKHFINGIFTELDWKTFLLHTTGYSSGDVNLLCREIAPLQNKILEKATHFRPLLGYNPDAKENTDITHWTPCSPTHPEAVKKTHDMIPKEDIVFPDLGIAKELFMTAAINRPPSLNIYDPDGPVVSCDEFSKIYRKSKKTTIDASNVFNLKPFDSASAYQEAKNAKQEQEGASLSEGQSDWTVPCRELAMVTKQDGKWCRIEQENASLGAMSNRPLPAIPELGKGKAVSQNRKSSILDKFLYLKNLFD